MTEPYWWRSFEERSDADAFRDALTQEFPQGEGVGRRRFLQLMASSMALAGVAACGPSPEEIVPRVDQVPDATPGTPRYVTSAVVREGYATGAILQHRMARPVKLEGNPDHPASLGASDAIMQAALLDFYDPDRSAAVLTQGRIGTWQRLDRAIEERRAGWARDSGAGLRVLTGRITSPTLAAQLAALISRYPNARWHGWEPLPRDAAHAGAVMAFGTAVEAVPDFERAEFVLGIESDALSGAPGDLAFARGFARRRRATEAGQGAMSRVYAIEATPTLLGARADHRFALQPAEIEAAMRAIAGHLGAGPGEWIGQEQPSWLEPLAQDLAAHRGAALVHAGPEQSPNIHALALTLNQALGASGRTLRFIERVDVDPGHTIADLVAEIQDGKVDTLLILDADPVYDAPADLGFAEALARVPLSIQLGTRVDETASHVTFHAPLAHAFETWSDARAFDGTATILQPQMQPLAPGRSAAQMVAQLAGAVDQTARGLVEAAWRPHAAGDFADAWTGWLRKGVVANSAAPAVEVRMRDDFADRLGPIAAAPQGTTTLLFRPDPFLRGGSLASNAWLQELPRPLTRLVWDNAALIAPATAQHLGIRTEDVVEIATGSGTARLPAYVLPGQAENCITLPLGYGHARIGTIGTEIGVNVYPLRTSGGLWSAGATRVRAIGERRRLASTQHHQDMAGRDLVRSRPVGTLAQAAAAPTDHASLYPPVRYDTDAWGMAISLDACIGCGACVAACQAENNTPVVGRDEVLRGREMHWIRVDRYWGGAPGNPETVFQPVPCMHCENAPCEVVCPVDATMHDHDGLNVMVYNRCIGTRFCSNNCPYKVRRFNFLGYAERDHRHAIAWNPDVTVRARGVMEKCTYCIQRIREAKIAADRDDRTLRDGDVRTACQQACPTEAIVFGNLADPASEVRKRKASPLDYALLEELNTRPRTTYAARLTNRNPGIAEG